MLLQEENLVPLFEVLCSEVENTSLRGITDVGLMVEAAAQGLKVCIVTLVCLFSFFGFT